MDARNASDHDTKRSYEEETRSRNERDDSPQHSEEDTETSEDELLNNNEDTRYPFSDDGDSLPASRASRRDNQFSKTV